MGTDPLAFVIAANLHRRHLNESQRAMVAARIATLKDGQRPRRQICLPSEKAAPQQPVTQVKAADLLNVAPRTIKDARVVQEKGTAELVAAAARAVRAELALSWVGADREAV